jgi:hypothetical protein
LFGKDTFKAEETFDTLIACEKCLGVSPESSMLAMHGVLPRKLIEDVGTLKTDVQTLNEKVRVLQQSRSGKEGSDAKDGPDYKVSGKEGSDAKDGPDYRAAKKKAAKEEEDEKTVVEKAELRQAASEIPTVVLSRAREGSAGEMREWSEPGDIPDNSGIENLLHVVAHQRARAPTILELFRRVSEQQ